MEGDIEQIIKHQNTPSSFGYCSSSSPLYPDPLSPLFRPLSPKILYPGSSELGC
jgi:hypothetical protein